MINFNRLGQCERAQMLFTPWTRGYLLDGEMALGRSQGDAFGRLPGFQDLLADEAASGETATSVLSKPALRWFPGERWVCDTDTMGMGVSPVIRAPFTDHEVISAARRAPPRSCVAKAQPTSPSHGIS